VYSVEQVAAGGVVALRGEARRWEGAKVVEVDVQNARWKTKATPDSFNFGGSSIWVFQVGQNKWKRIGLMVLMVSVDGAQWRQRQQKEGRQRCIEKMYC
jgi:hypothetical protein